MSTAVPRTGNPLRTGFLSGSKYAAAMRLHAAVMEALEPRQLLTTVPTFAPDATFITGKDPVAVVTADFNHDGDLDFATADSGSGTVTIRRGKGDGTFRPATTITVGSDPTDLVVGDFNRDGKMDFAVAVDGLNQVLVYLGSGDGATFTKSATLDAGNLPPGPTAFSGGARIVTGDFDGDGKLDLAVTNNADETVSVFLGQGNGQFGARIVTAEVDNESPYFDANALTAGDFNHDGKTDLAVGGEDTIDVLTATGSGHFAAAQDLESAGVLDAGYTDLQDLAVADVNGDGNLDLLSVSGDYDDAIIIFGNSNGTFSNDQSLVTARSGYDEDRVPVAIVSADFNNDSLPDLAVVNAYYGSRTVFASDGNGGYISRETPAYPSDSETEPAKASADIAVDLVAGDFNNDGKQDILTADPDGNEVTLLLNTTDLKTVGSPQIDSFEAYNYGPAAADKQASFNFSTEAYENNGTIANVKYYIDTDGVAGLNPASDTLLATVTSNGSKYKFTFDSTGYTPGSYVVYAVATDSTGHVTQASQTITVPPISHPQVSLQINPSSVTLGTSSVQLSASTSDDLGTIRYVTFFRESNGTTGLQNGTGSDDTYVGNGSLNSDGTWTTSASTGNLGAGTYQYYAVATDSNGYQAVGPANLVVLAPAVTPAINSFTVTPNQAYTFQQFTLSATASVTSTNGGVHFYLESNGQSGLQIGSDTDDGEGTCANGVWTATFAVSNPGTYTFYAVAENTDDVQSSPAVATLTATVQQYPPVINSFSAGTGDAKLKLYANADEPNGTITSVQFYLESNGQSGLQSTDTLLGTGAGDQSYSLTVSSSHLASGNYTAYAVATDSYGVSTTAMTTFSLNGGSTTQLPGAPTDIAGTATATVPNTIKWSDTAGGETRFEIERSTSSTFSNPTTFTAAANVASYVDTSAVKGTYYYYCVRAVNSVGDSAYTKSVKLKTLYTGSGGGSTGTVLAAPTTLSGKAVTGPAVQLGWTDNASGETGYEIEVSTASNFSTIFKDITVSTANLAAYTVTGLPAKTYYYFRVRAINSTEPALDSAWSTSVKIKTLSA